MDRVQPRGPNMRLLVVGTVLIALTAGYLLLLRNFNVSELPSERHFGAADPIVPAGEVHLEPIRIDALNNTMQVRAYLSPSVTETKDAHGVPSRDLTVLVSHDKTVEEVKLAAADHIASSTFEIGLNGGTVAHYPLDACRVRFGVRLLDGNLAAPPGQRHDVGRGARVQSPYGGTGSSRSGRR